jgi:hypothetical protein
VCGEGGVRGLPSSEAIEPWGEPNGFTRENGSETRSAEAVTMRGAAAPGPESADPLEPDWLVAKLLV